MKIHGMLLVRNEVDRWLHNYLDQHDTLVDRLIVLDDASTDGSDNICRDYGANVYSFFNKTSLWESNELALRKELWRLTTEQANDGDWILCLDADELFVSGHMEYIKYLCKVLPIGVNGIGFRLHDMWSDTKYRDDEHWQAHKYLWPMMVRYRKGFDYQWLEKPLHCGRFPANASNSCYPTMIPIKHMGWSREADREKKFERYMRIDPCGENGILAQYQSIMDENPTLREF